MATTAKQKVRLFFLLLNLGGLYNFASRLKSYAFFIWLDRWLTRRNYARIVRRIRKYPPSRIIKVAFVVTETAKWKAQSLYDILKHSKDFEPFIVLSAPIDDVKYFGNDIKDKLEKDRIFYEGLGCRCVTNFVFQSGRPRPLREYSPDIVFFQDPRLSFEEDNVPETTKSALCCYIPYSLSLVGENRPYLVHPWFQQKMFMIFMPTCAQADSFATAVPKWQWSGEIEIAGHPMLDQFFIAKSKAKTDKSHVIYAPHFSFPLSNEKRPITLSSFLDNGLQILEYAECHPEFNWVFKPHPVLYKELVTTKTWAKEDVDKYYDRWAKIGTVAVQGDYIELFMESRAMITDCGSFLAEFPMTGQPLIHLVPDYQDFPTHPMFDKLLASFYTVHNLDEMYSAFEMVLERGEDPKKADRIKAVRELGLIGGKTSAERIMEKLQEVCGRSVVAR